MGKNNLIPMNERTVEEQREIARKGGVASGKVRKEKATMRKVLEDMLEEISNIEDDKGKKLTYKQLATLGLIKGAIDGNATNYKTILEIIGELQEDKSITTPTLSIEIIDNSNLERTLYEENERSK